MGPTFAPSVAKAEASLFGFGALRYWRTNASGRNSRHQRDDPPNSWCQDVFFYDLYICFSHNVMPHLYVPYPFCNKNRIWIDKCWFYKLYMRAQHCCTKHPRSWRSVPHVDPSAVRKASDHRYTRRPFRDKFSPSAVKSLDSSYPYQLKKISDNHVQYQIKVIITSELLHLKCLIV